MIKLYIALLSCLFVGCSGTRHTSYPYGDLVDKVSSIRDSVTVGKMTIHNAFKHQILAHKDGRFDSVSIVDKVYRPNRYAFDNCLSQIFGDNNKSKFQPAGIVAWNRTLLRDNATTIGQKMALLDSIDVDALFAKHLNAPQDITGQRGQGKWLVYFGPKDFQIFGGCDDNSMILDMMGSAWTRKSIDKVFAHELEHLLFNPVLEKDVHGKTGLGITLDEGLAVHFTYLYLRQTIPDALYGNETPLLLQREKEIFTALEPFLFKTNDEGCPIFRHCGRNSDCKPVITGLSEEATNELCYFMGFRIIEKYVEKNGKDSWKDIYEIPLKTFYERSGYREYINSLK